MPSRPHCRRGPARPGRGAWPTSTGTPDREFTVLREALSAYLARQAGASIPVAALWAANGSNEVLLHLVQAFGGGDRVARVHARVLDAPGSSPRPARCRGPTATAAHPATRSADPGVGRGTVRPARPGDGLPLLAEQPHRDGADPEVVIAAYEAAPRAVIVVDEAYAEYARPGTRSALHLLAGGPGSSSPDDGQGLRAGRWPARLSRRRPRARRRAAAGPDALPPVHPDPGHRPGGPGARGRPARDGRGRPRRSATGWSASSRRPGWTRCPATRTSSLRRARR